MWFIQFSYDSKPRYGLVMASAPDARLALASVVAITTRFAGTPYEVRLPRVPWLREQSFINAQSLQPVEFSECTHKAPGQFDRRVFDDVQRALKRWLGM